MWSQFGSLTLSAVIVAQFLGASATAEEFKAGPAIEYQPFYPENWKKNDQSTQLFPWEGERVVFLTNRDDLDGPTMKRIVNRLDAGWNLYADLIGQSPGVFKRHNEKVIIAAVPDASYTCGYGCGYIGSEGVELAGFYANDYPLVQKQPDAFPHYYFYEQGRNYFVFGERHSLFTTGVAVFMRNVCMDTLKCDDPDLETRRAIERAEEIYSKSADEFEPVFIGNSGLKDKDGNPVPLTDINCMYASVMLKLRAEQGGNDWVRRFYHQLRECPPAKGADGDQVRGQVLNWVVAASCAAQEDLTSTFTDRWRFPVPPKCQAALKDVNWKLEEISARQVIASLPADELPLAWSVSLPQYLTPERRKANLLTDGSFEGAGKAWNAFSFLNNPKAAKSVANQKKGGKKSVQILTANEDDVRYSQKVAVKPNTRYLLSGWIKTVNVAVQSGAAIGANLSLEGGYESSETIVGDADWTYVTLVFDSGTRTEVTACARLGFYNSIAKGSAWFDDLCLIELPAKKEAEK